MTLALVDRESRQRLDQALEQLAAEVKQQVPALRYSIQHGGNDSFPWWVVARFVNGANETRVVDVPIDCRGTPHVWSVRADVTREDGFVLKELPALPLNGLLHDERAPGSVEDVLRPLEGFLIRQAQCISEELKGNVQRSDP